MQISHNYTYITSLSSLPPLPDPRSSQSTRLGSLCYTATSHQLSLLHMAAYICKMVLMSLFVGKEWRCRYRELACGHSGGRKEGQKDVFFKRITLLLLWECTIARQDWKQGDYLGGFCNNQIRDDDGSDHHWGFLGGSAVKNRLSIQRCEFDSGSGRSRGGGNGNSLQRSCLKNPMDRGAW